MKIIKLCAFIVGIILVSGSCYPGVPFVCQVAQRALKEGDIVLQAYCPEDFPYCETWSGNCCSEPSYATENGGICCDTDVYTRHWVSEIEIGNLGIKPQAYKCCSIAEYGKKSTYYFDKDKHVHCCGGEVFKEKSTDESPQCCNHRYDEKGNVTRYYKTATVDGRPTGETEKICCEVLGGGSGEYKQTAYWNGGAVCCDGKTHKTGKETYSCCVGSKGKNKTHKVIDEVLGAPNGEEACCDIATYGTSPTAYWNGSSAQCCKGKARKNGVDSNGKEVYACCTGDTAENPTHKKVSVLDAPHGEETCCDIATYGANPTAYWNGSSAQCCKGEAKKKSDGTYVCCPVVDSCPDGSTPTPNYVDDVEGTCGSICCEWKKDYTQTEAMGIDDDVWAYVYEGWTIVGSTNGKCCSGYTGGGSGMMYKDGVDIEMKDTYSYAIHNNNGGYYCAVTWDCEEVYLDISYGDYYPSVSKVCHHVNGEDEEGGCKCSSKGDPARGSTCE